MSSENQETSISFDELGLNPAILKSIKEAGYESPSPIQQQSIPSLIEGRDLLGQAQTGTGKTAAFSLPLLNRLNSTQKTPQILVLTPTRELAIQVAEAMKVYGRYLKNFHVLPIYGGQSMTIQLRALQRNPQVIVGTPGRMLDHIRRGKINLSDLQALVLDEADEMLRMGFIDDVETILEETPKTRQVALFSATMPKQIHRVATRYLQDPVEIHVKSKTSTVSTITQRYWQVSGLHKLDALTRILEVEEFDGMIIFVRTKNSTVDLAEKLEARGYSASALNGDMNQALREKTVQRMKVGKLDILIATDVAARGLDIERMSHVVNYDIPYDTESYVHRIGRTGRAGRQGQAILFVSPREQRMLGAIEKATKQKIERMHLPSSEDIADRRVMSFKAKLTETIESQDLTFFEEIINQYQSEHNTAPEKAAAALAYLVQKNRPLKPVAHKSERPERSDRGARGDRGDRSKNPSRRDSAPRSRKPREAEAGMVTYRLEVGSADNVEPKNIVGAIANEAGMDSQNIGRISIMDDHSFVDLPEGMPRDIFQHLRKVWVNKKPLQISLASGSSEEEDSRPSEKKAKKPRKTLTRKPAAEGDSTKSKPKKRIRRPKA